MKQFLLTLSCLVLLLLWIDYTEAHPDGATPYWYPSNFIYGYINGCADQVEKKPNPIYTNDVARTSKRSMRLCS